MFLIRYSVPLTEGYDRVFFLGLITNEMSLSEPCNDMMRTSHLLIETEQMRCSHPQKLSAENDISFVTRFHFVINSFF